MLAELLIQFVERLHLPFALGRRCRRRGGYKLGIGVVAGLKRRGRHGRAEITAGQLHGRRRPADVHERRQVLVRGAQRIRDPASEGRMIELPAAMAGAGFDHGREMVAFVAPHRSDDGDLVDHAADVREPIGNRNAATCHSA